MNNYLIQKYPNADDTVLAFIEDFTTLQGIFDDTKASTVQTLFSNGYCYHFALILKNIFERGEICWCAPYGHICWVDDNKVPYDIYGICDSECDYYIPVSYISKGLDDFKHIKGKIYNASQEYIDNAIEKYKEDNYII